MYLQMGQWDAPCVRQGEEETVVPADGAAAERGALSFTVALLASFLSESSTEQSFHRQHRNLTPSHLVSAHSWLRRVHVTGERHRETSANTDRRTPPSLTPFTDRVASTSQPLTQRYFTSSKAMHPLTGS